MGHLYDQRDNAIEHTVQKDDTLGSIAQKYKGQGDVPEDLDWKEIALYNWATVAEAEVVRALAERVGSAVPSAVVEGGDPGGLKLDPAFGPSDPQPILVPKLWKPKGLEVNKKHTVEVIRRTPASAVGITRLDKWFIPAHETCEVAYAAVGDPGLADTVSFEVYASNYVELTSWNDGLPEFKALPGVPVYAAEATGGQISDWKGLSKCDQGALSPEGHPLNVAFSPYTVSLRYAKKGQHGDARIALDPFWVAFDERGEPLPDSCKIKWKIENATLALGLLLIADRSGEIVFAKGLSKGDLESGTFAWNGKDAKGDLVVAGGMPYRVQIQAHTGIDTEDGLALAAMHTEVRLYAHPETLPIDVNAYDPSKDKVSLDLSIADLYHKDDPPQEGDGTLWTKHVLAEAGFHPGPVTDATATDDFKRALHEFQRSVPKAGGSAGSFERMKVEDDETDAKAALAALDSFRKRPWFGKPAEPGDTPDLGWRPGNWGDTKAGDFMERQRDAEFLERLRDPTKRMIVWIDDRNWYTDGAYWQYGFYDTTVVVSADNLKKIHDAVEDLGGADKSIGRGSFEDRDERVDHDVRDIARPWIPLQVDFRLLGKGQELDAEVAPHEGEVAEKVRAAVGPLRVDWTFDEIEETEPVASVTEGTSPVSQALPKLDRESDVLLSKLYHPASVHGDYARPEATRTRMALRWVLDKLKKEHQRKDVKRKSVYYNAPEARGGIRPDDPDAYFKAALGHGGESLAPWTGAPDDGRQSICTAVHDAVRQGEGKVFAKRLGRAGIYFHPSRIAGDGFQVRGQVRFDDKGPYVCPNAAALRARYPRWPQAHTAQFRMWRKTTLRGYVQWTSTDDWSAPGDSCFANLPQTGPDEWRAHYTACHVSIENELAVGSDALVARPAALFPDANDYYALVADALETGDARKDPTNGNGWMTLSNGYAWPWSGHAHYGVVVPVFGTSFDDACIKFRRKLNCDHVTIAIRMSLALVQAIERQTGRMRGHVLVRYDTTASCHFREYYCAACRAAPVYLQSTDSGALMRDKSCPGCKGGPLAPTYLSSYTCGAGHVVSLLELGVGTAIGRKCKATGCLQTLTSHGGSRERVSSYSYKRGKAPFAKDVNGVPSPSCGFPVGVFWNVTGDASLWAHELGHNRHYEHAADAQQKGTYSARPEHDNAVNDFIATKHVGDKDENKGWDRACLMSYVGQKATYDDKRDMPCFCFKCVLKNRGWRLNPPLKPLPTPAKDLQDVEGV